MLSTVVSNVELYRAGFPQLVSLSLKDPTFWRQMESQRRESLIEWQSKNGCIELSDKVRSEMDKSGLFLNKKKLQIWNNEYIPLLNPTEILNRPTCLTPIDIILEIFKNQKQIGSIEKILKENCLLTDKEQHFRVDLLDGRPMIYGNNMPIFKSVVSLAHEIGHIIVETGAVRDIDPSRHSVVGEVFAHCLEKMVGHHLLSGDQKGQRKWIEWCDDVDAMNFYFYNLESEGSDLGATEEIDFNQQSLVLRQSYYCVSGFQYVNAISSLLRRRLNLGI